MTPGHIYLLSNRYQNLIQRGVNWPKCEADFSAYLVPMLRMREDINTRIQYAFSIRVEAKLHSIFGY